MKYNQQYYRVFGDDPKAIVAIDRSLTEPSLADLVERWLERTPGLEAEGFNFWGKYQRTVQILLEQQKRDAEVSDGEEITYFTVFKNIFLNICFDFLPFPFPL